MDKLKLEKYNSLNTRKFSLNGLKVYARVVSIHDGDTITCIFPYKDEYYKWNIRLSNIDTCEINTTNNDNRELAIKARNKLCELITNQTEKYDKKYFDNNMYLVYIECFDFDKYNRLLCEIYDINDKSKSFSEILIENNLAYKYTGKTKLTEEEQINILKN